MPMSRQQWIAALLVATALAAIGVIVAATGWAPRSASGGAGPALVSRSEFRGFEVQLIPEASPVPVNVMQAWVIRVRNAEGKPVTGATVEFDAQMPAHGHGLPTAPQVTGEVAPGDYRLEGLRFSMPGHWVLRVNVNVQQRTDTLHFELQL